MEKDLDVVKSGKATSFDRLEGGKYGWSKWYSSSQVGVTDMISHRGENFVELFGKLYKEDKEEIQDDFRYFRCIGMDSEKKECQQYIIVFDGKISVKISKIHTCSRRRKRRKKKKRKIGKKIVKSKKKKFSVTRIPSSNKKTLETNGKRVVHRKRTKRKRIEKKTTKKVSKSTQITDSEI